MIRTSKDKTMTDEQQNYSRQCNLLSKHARTTQRNVDNNNKNDINVVEEEEFAQNTTMHGSDINNNEQQSKSTNMEYNISTMPSLVLSETTPIRVKSKSNNNEHNGINNTKNNTENSSSKWIIPSSSTPDQVKCKKLENVYNIDKLSTYYSYNVLTSRLTGDNREHHSPPDFTAQSQPYHINLLINEEEKSKDKWQQQENQLLHERQAHISEYTEQNYNNDVDGKNMKTHNVTRKEIDKYNSNDNNNNKEWEDKLNEKIAKSSDVPNLQTGFPTRRRSLRRTSRVSFRFNTPNSQEITQMHNYLSAPMESLELASFEPLLPNTTVAAVDNNVNEHIHYDAENYNKTHHHAQVCTKHNRENLLEATKVQQESHNKKAHSSSSISSFAMEEKSLQRSMSVLSMPSLTSISSTLSSHMSDIQRSRMASFAAHSSSCNVLDPSCDDSVNMNNSAINSNNIRSSNNNNNSNSSCSKISDESRNISEVALSESYMCNFDNASSNQSDISTSINNNNNSNNNNCYNRSLQGRKYDSKLISGKTHLHCKNNTRVVIAIMKNDDEHNSYEGWQHCHNNNNNNNNKNNMHDTTKIKRSCRKDCNSPLFDDEYNQPISKSNSFINEFSFGECKYHWLIEDDSQEQTTPTFQEHTKEQEVSDITDKNNKNINVTTSPIEKANITTTAKPQSAHDQSTNAVTRRMEWEGRRRDSRSMSLTRTLELSENSVKNRDGYPKYSQTEEKKQTQQQLTTVIMPSVLPKMERSNVESNRHVSVVIPQKIQETEPNVPLIQEQKQEQQRESERIQRLPSHCELQAYSPLTMHTLSNLTVENLHRYKQQEEKSKWQVQTMHEPQYNINNSGNSANGFILTASNNRSLSRLSEASSGNHSRSRSSSTCRSSSHMSNSSIDSGSVARLKRKAQIATQQFVQRTCKEKECNVQLVQATTTNKKKRKIQPLSAVEVISETPTRVTNVKNDISAAQQEQEQHKTRSNSKSFIKRILHRCFTGSEENKTSGSETATECSMDKSIINSNSYKGNFGVSTSLIENSKRVPNKMLVPENEHIASAPLATRLKKRHIKNDKCNVHIKNNNKNNTSANANIQNCEYSSYTTTKSDQDVDDDDCVVLETSACGSKPDELTQHLLNTNLNAPSREIHPLHAFDSNSNSSNNKKKTSSRKLEHCADNSVTLPLIRKVNFSSTNKSDFDKIPSSNKINCVVSTLQEVAEYDETFHLPNYVKLSTKKPNTTNVKVKEHIDVSEQTEQNEVKVKENNVEAMNYSKTNVNMSKQETILSMEKISNKKTSQSLSKLRNEHKKSHRSQHHERYKNVAEKINSKPEYDNTESKVTFEQRSYAPPACSLPSPHITYSPSMIAKSSSSFITSNIVVTDSNNVNTDSATSKRERKSNHENNVNYTDYHHKDDKGNYISFHNVHNTNSDSHHDSSITTESINSSSRRNHFTPHTKRSSSYDINSNTDMVNFNSDDTEQDVKNESKNLESDLSCTQDMAVTKERSVCDLRNLIALSSLASSKEREDIIHERLSSSSGRSINSQSWRRRLRDRHRSSSEPFRPFKISAEKFKQVQAEKLKEISQFTE